TQAGFFNDVVVRHGAFAYYRHAGSKIVVKFAAFVVLHFALSKDQTHVGEVLKVPNAPAVDRADTGHRIAVQPIDRPGADEKQANAPGFEKSAKPVQALLPQ